MERILRGVSRFQTEVYPQLESRFRELAKNQEPEALFITCADSRVVPDMITQSRPGDLFICRNAGNIVPAHGEVTGGVSATIEYAVTALHVRHVIVCGHSDCGAMKGILHPEAVTHMPAVRSWLHYGDAARRVVLDMHPNLTDDEKLERLVRENVRAQLLNLRTHPSVASGLAVGTLSVHGWVYDIRSGAIEAYDDATGRFRPLGRSESTAAPQPRYSEVG